LSHPSTLKTTRKRKIHQKHLILRTFCAIFSRKRTTGGKKMKMLGRYNWYLPKWLEWIPNVSLGEQPV
jgi:hypothetical protein